MSSERKRIIKEVFHKPKEVPQESHQVVNSDGINPELAKLFPPERIEKIKAKALRRYKRRQDVQWERYLESMSK